MKTLIAYGTTDGMTARIAARIAETLRGLGHEALAVDTAALPPALDPRDFDGVLVGASLHVGGHQRSAARFVRRHRAALAERPSGFFSVCMAIASRDPKERAEAHRLATRFPATLGWRPDAIAVFAGALMWSRYGWLRRAAMRSIARREMDEPVDTAHDRVFTDWADVDGFARAFAARVAAARSAAERTSAAPAPPA
jgi:menaquinone-dependent protoporphyrinogen oxidase